MLSIILPTYNERDNIEVLLNKISTVCAKENIEHEIILVDDNSPDKTAEAAKSMGLPSLSVIVREKKSGLGSAVLEGVRRSKGDDVCIMDTDLQHDPEDIPRLLAALENSSVDIALGSRHVAGASSVDFSFFRNFISRTASASAKLILGIDVKDPESGFAIIKRQVFDTAGLNPIGYKILLELMYKSSARVIEVPIHFKKRIHGKSKLGCREILNYLRLLFALKFSRRGALR